MKLQAEIAEGPEGAAMTEIQWQLRCKPFGRLEELLAVFVLLEEVSGAILTLNYRRHNMRSLEGAGLMMLPCDASHLETLSLLGNNMGGGGWNGHDSSLSSQPRPLSWQKGCSHRAAAGGLWHHREKEWP